MENEGKPRRAIVSQAPRKGSQEEGLINILRAEESKLLSDIKVFCDFGGRSYYIQWVEHYKLSSITGKSVGNEETLTSKFYREV